MNKASKIQFLNQQLDDYLNVSNGYKEMEDGGPLLLQRLEASFGLSEKETEILYQALKMANHNKIADLMDEEISLAEIKNLLNKLSID